LTDVNEDIQTLRDADAQLATLEPEPFHLPVDGLESVVVGALRGLSKTDWWVPGLRERIGCVLRGVPVTRMVDGFAGARPYQVAPPTASPALRALHAVGLAMAEPDRTVLVHLGIGSVADGSFYEALNLASLQQARVVFLVAVPSLEGAPVPTQVAATPMAVAQAFGMTAVSVDGRDAAAVEASVAAARQQAGPTLIEARLASHTSSSTEEQK
jgi:TPP-dependent pyruvate/acetoin dehydrogenase alpha subunit